MFKVIKIITWKHVIVYSILTLLIYFIMIFFTLEKITDDINGILVFDLSPMGYSLEEAKIILDSMSYETKNFYKFVQLPIDFLYPIILALFMSSFFIKIRAYFKVPSIFIYSPFVITLFDYSENVLVYFMLNDIYNSIIVNISSVCTILKSISTTINMVFAQYVREAIGKICYYG